MPRRLFIMNRLLSILGDSLRPLKLVSILMSIIAAIAIMLHRTNDPHDDMALLTQIMPDIYWIILFLGHALIRYVHLFTSYAKVLKYSCHVAASMGIWLWSMMFVGGALMTPMEAMTLLYGTIIIVEVWILVRAITDTKISDEQ